MIDDGETHKKLIELGLEVNEPPRKILFLPLTPPIVSKSMKSSGQVNAFEYDQSTGEWNRIPLEIIDAFSDQAASNPKCDLVHLYLSPKNSTAWELWPS